MAGGTLTTTAAAVAEYMNGLVDTLDLRKSVLQQAIPETMSVSDDSYKWNVHYGGNSSTTSYSEGDAISAAGNELYATAEIAYSTGYLRTIYTMTGHAKDNAKNGYFDAMGEEAKGALMGHVDGREEALITALEAAVDSAGSYAGLLRATHKLASYEAAAGGALAVSDLDTLYETLTADPVGAQMENHVIFSPIDTHGEYNDVAAGTGAGDQLTLANQQGETLDGGRFKFTAKYNGIPWVDVPGMTTGGLVCVDTSVLRRVTHRPITVEPLAKVDDSDRFAITSSQILVVRNPRVCGKITT